MTESEISSVRPTPSTPTTTTWPSWQPPAPTTTLTPDLPVEVATEDEDAVEVEAGGPPPPSTTPGTCNGNLFLAHKKDCRKYYLCNFGQLTELTCPNGLFWNNDHCDWPENTKCKKLPESGSIVRYVFSIVCLL